MSEERDEVADALRRSQSHETGSHAGASSMGVSSERVGRAGPGQEGVDGLRSTARTETPDRQDVPEQRPGGEETNPTGLAPKADYPQRDPRSSEDSGNTTGVGRAVAQFVRGLVRR